MLEHGPGLVERTYPLGMEGKPRYARYRVVDPFFEFWFTAIHTHKNLIELDPGRALGIVLRHVEAEASRAWEEVAKQHMLLLRSLGEIEFTRIGSWWWRDTEIDLVAIDEENNVAYFVEYKWGPADNHTATRLKAKAQNLPWKRENKTRKIHHLRQELQGNTDRAKHNTTPPRRR